MPLKHYSSNSFLPSASLPTGTLNVGKHVKTSYRNLFSKSGKTEKVHELIESFVKKGYQEIDAKGLYPLTDELINMRYIIGAVEPHKTITNQISELAFTYISANDVRKELADVKNDDLVFYVIDKRIKEALDRGISVIYEATNLDISTRQHYIQLAGPVQKDLYIMNVDAEYVNTNL